MLGEAQSLVETFYSSEVMEAPDGGSKLPAMVVWGNLAIYIVAWGLLMWPQHLPLGRPCIAMVFAAMAAGLRELCHKAWPEKDYPSLDIFGKINPTPIALLFGLMLVNAYLQDTGLWKHVERVVDSVSPRVLLVKVCVFAAATSALLTNDTTCLMLTPLVLKLCARRGARDVQPYLMAVATSSNIGSSLTIIGNPQNALIASISPGMSFLGFMKDMLLPTVLGLVLNTSALYLYYRRVLAFDQPGESDVEVATVIEHRCAWGLYAVGVGVVVVAMLVGWILNMNTDEVALAAGSTLMLLRALRRRYSGEDAKEKDTETRFALGAIDYPILVLFIGQFILVGATVDTGLPQRLFRLILGPCAGHLAQSPVCLLWFAGVVLLLSNVISNVPVILMLQPLLASQPHAVRQIWTVCAWTATVSGNLTLMGSAANLIVAHVAEAQDVPFTATSYSKFALIPTLVITALGVLLLPPLGPSWAWLVGACMAALLLLGGLCRARREPALLECTA